MVQNSSNFARVCKVNRPVKKLNGIGVHEENNNNITDDESDCESFYKSVLFDSSQINAVSKDWFEIIKGGRGSEKFNLDSGADINKCIVL